METKSEILALYTHLGAEDKFNVLIELLGEYRKSLQQRPVESVETPAAASKKRKLGDEPDSAESRAAGSTSQDDENPLPHGIDKKTAKEFINVLDTDMDGKETVEWLKDKGLETCKRIVEWDVARQRLPKAVAETMKQTLQSTWEHRAYI